MRSIITHKITIGDLEVILRMENQNSTMNPFIWMIAIYTYLKLLNRMMLIGSSRTFQQNLRLNLESLHSWNGLYFLFFLLQLSVVFHTYKVWKQKKCLKKNLNLKSNTEKDLLIIEFCRVLLLKVVLPNRGVNRKLISLHNSLWSPSSHSSFLRSSSSGINLLCLLLFIRFAIMKSGRPKRAWTSPLLKN